MKHRLFRLAGSLLSLLVVSTIGSGPAWAYNEDTHQHITELAYGYLKAAALCDRIPVAGGAEIQTCVSTCEAAFTPPAGAQTGYSCGCARDTCGESPLSGCAGLTGLAKYRCVEDCMADGAGQICGSKDAGCARPYYWESAQSTPIVTMACAEDCFEETHLVFTDECAALQAAQAGSLRGTRAADTVEWFQSFETSPCPPRRYAYAHGQCEGDLTTSTRSLVEWDEALMEDTRVEPNLAAPPGDYKTGFRPILGHLLGATVFATNAQGQRVVDLSGTIVGLHAGATDWMKNLYIGARFFPLLEDTFKLLGEGAIAVGGGGAALAVAAGGLALCALSCPVTVFFGKCDDCFKKTASTAKQILEGAGEAIEQLEEANLFPTIDSHQGFGHNFTSFFHFMNTPPREYDDIDGIRPATAFGVGGALALQLFDLSMIDDVAVDARVVYRKSDWALDNYQMVAADDGMSDSEYRSAWYWQRRGLENYTFPPVDNLAYYWWHKWLQGRADGLPDQEYGLLPLGAVLHAAQDLTQPFHVLGITLQGHAPYEDRISNRMDPAMAWKNDPQNQNLPGRLMLNLGDEGEEQELLRRVSAFIAEIDAAVIQPAGGVLRPRRLMHYLRGRVGEAGRQFGTTWANDMPLFSWFDMTVEEDFIRETGLPLAIAASVVILVEGAGDVAPYEQELNLALAQFEHEDGVPEPLGAPLVQPLEAAPGAPLPYGAHDSEWACAAQSPAAMGALDAYLADQTTGRALLQTLYAERMRCRIQESGLPVPAGAILQELGAYEQTQVEATLGVFQHGSLVQLEQELACNSYGHSDVLGLGEAEHARVKARCLGILDSDGDGVLDQDDHCHTPQKVLDDGHIVAANGCAFVHEASPEPRVSPYVPGAERVSLLP